MNIHEAFLLLSVLCSSGISQGNPQTTPEVGPRSKQFTFRFIELAQVFRAKIQVTPKTEEETFISIPCKNIYQQRVTLKNQSIWVNSCDTVQVFSTADVTVHGMVSSSVGFTGGFLALPHDQLGNEYLIDCYQPKDRSAQVAISAVNNDTTVNIDCANNCTFNNRNVSGPIKLRAGESGILKNSEKETEITGTYITSDKPISVVVGAENVYIPRGHTEHGLILEQLLPISSWGLVHIVPSFNEMPNDWMLRIMAINSGTTVAMTGCGSSTSLSTVLQSKNYTDVFVNSQTTNLCNVQATGPVQVMQYVASANSSQYGDPSMNIIPPVIDYHGNTTIHIRLAKPKMRFFADVVIPGKERELLHINDSSVPVSKWNCVNSTINCHTFCHSSIELQNGTYHITHLQQSGRFWVRIYTLHKTLGAAMLGDIRIAAQRSKDETTTVMGCEDELRNAITDLNNRFPSDFPNYADADEALDFLSTYLTDKEDLGSVNEADEAFTYFTGLLRRNPLANATVNETKSFLNKTSSVLNVLFSNNTNEQLTKGCSEGRNLTSSVEDTQHEMEMLMTQASELIVDGAIYSFEVSRENAAISISSTNATSSITASGLEDCEGDLNLPGYDVTIPCDVVEELGSRAVYQVTLPFGGDAITSSKCRDDEIAIGSPLFSIGLVSNRTVQRFKNNISLSFVTRSLEVDVLENNTLCSFWDYTKSNWSTSGCTLGSIDTSNGETRVTCLCDHLTSFAVLIDVSPGEIDEVNEEIMTLLSWIGCSFSIAACFLTCFGYAILRLRSDLILVHGNLALAVGLAETAFLCLDVVKNPSENRISCIIIASFIYYHFMAMFAWMAIEGIHLYLMTFVVWNAERRKIKSYMACGWGIPILFVVAMVSVYREKLASKKYCFLSMADNSLLFFIVPVAVVIVFNVFVTIRVVAQIIKMADGPTMQSDIKTRAKYGVKAMVVLLPLMGLTWVVGFLAFDRAKITLLYIFIVLNCLQGVFIFFIHFYRNSEVRKAFRRQREKWAVSHTWNGESSSSKNTRRKSSSSGGEKNLETLRTPMQTMTLSNVKTNKTIT